MKRTTCWPRCGRGFGRSSRAALAIVCLAATTAACASSGSPDTAAPTEAVPTAIPTVAADASGAQGASTASEFAVTNTTWQWESMTVRPGGETTTVPDPTQYTAVFAPDGTLSGQADCNSYSGTWSEQGGGYQIQVTTSTMAACAEGSLDQTFLQSLAMVVAGGPAATGRLALESAGAERRMLFRNGGPAGGQ